LEWSSFLAGRLSGWVSEIHWQALWLYIFGQGLKAGLFEVIRAILLQAGITSSVSKLNTYRRTSSWHSTTWNGSILHCEARRSVTSLSLPCVLSIWAMATGKNICKVHDLFIGVQLQFFRARHLPQFPFFENIRLLFHPSRNFVCSSTLSFPSMGVLTRATFLLFLLLLF